MAKELKLAGLNLVDFHGVEAWTNGYEMMQRARKLNAHLGMRYAKYLFKRQDLIPKHWQRHSVIFFPGRTWDLNNVGDEVIFYLLWDGEDWHLQCLYKRDSWPNLHGRLARARC